MSFSISEHLSSDYFHECPISKFKRLPFVSNNNFSLAPFDVTHLVGSLQHTHDEKYYFLTIVDGCSRIDNAKELTITNSFVGKRNPSLVFMSSQATSKLCGGEKKYQYLLNMAWALLFQARLPLQF
ncbi:hypothetical protein CR513_58557, partial [Mucuna pruriens]